MTTESGASSSQPLSDVIISYLKASALGHWQKAVQLISAVGLCLLLLCSGLLLNASQNVAQSGREEKLYEKWLKLMTQQSVHYG